MQDRWLPKTVVAYPGGGAFAQQAALAFQEEGRLAAFVTALAYDPQGPWARLLEGVPGPLARRLRSELERRVVALDPALVVSQPFWETLRTAASRAGVGPVVVDRLWDRLSHAFDRFVASRFAGEVEAVYAYEYTALASFQRAKAAGGFAILDLPSLNSRAYEALQSAERARHPELKGPHDRYFAARFERRQARRDAEVALADVIVTNSTLNMRSHVAAGADPGKFVVAPLAAPAPVAEVERPFAPTKPMSVVWAGAFSLRKGAHILMEALAGPILGLRVDVYGERLLPTSAMGSCPSFLAFHGSAPQGQLFAAFDQADVLVFPTLSDGFGLVVGEAFARGLPVITTDQAGAADLVRPGENGLIVPAGDADALRAALTWCQDNRLALHAMRQAALETARRWQWSDYRQALRQGISEKLAPPLLVDCVVDAEPARA